MDRIQYLYQTKRFRLMVGYAEVKKTEHYHYLTVWETIKYLWTGKLPGHFILKLPKDTNVLQEVLDKHEEKICAFITGDGRIGRKETVKTMFDAMKKDLKDGR